MAAHKMKQLYSSKLISGAVAIYLVVYVVNMRRFHNETSVFERPRLTFSLHLDKPTPPLTHSTTHSDLSQDSVFDVNMALSGRIEAGRNSSSHLIAFAQMMRLGNQMLQLASTYGIARSYPPGTWRMCISPNATYLLDGFPAVAALPRCDPEKLPEPRTHFLEADYAKYDPRTLHMETNKSMLVRFYFQSWRYFQNHSTEIRKLLRFYPSVIERARNTLTTSVEQHFRCKDCFSDVITVGVHIRRGDMVHLASRGHKVAAEGYITRAMQYLDTALNVTSKTRRLFVVSSDDITWCQKNIVSKDLVFATTSNYYIDMAILSMCRHTIMTVGTFGWWAGWLADGMTVYYKEHAVPGSKLEAGMNQQDYFRPNWIGLS